MFVIFVNTFFTETMIEKLIVVLLVVSAVVVVSTGARKFQTVC